MSEVDIFGMCVCVWGSVIGRGSACSVTMLKLASVDVGICRGKEVRYGG